MSIVVAPLGAELLEFRLQAGHRLILEAPSTAGVLNQPLQSATELQSFLLQLLYDGEISYYTYTPSAISVGS